MRFGPHQTIVARNLSRGTGSKVTSMIRLLLLLFLSLTSLATAGPIDRGAISVVDGDTIRVSGEPSAVRLVGFNTPETRGAACPAERTAGNAAARRLRQIVAAGGLDLTFVRCACARGTEGTLRCNHGRRCGVLRSRGRDVGEILIGEEHAVPFVCGETRCPETPRPWCGS
jgi:endonuclease YncB( thermonuclease family)